MFNIDDSFVFIKSENMVESCKIATKIITRNLDKRFVVIGKLIRQYDQILSGILEKYLIGCNRNYGVSLVGERISNFVFSCVNFLLHGLKKENIFDFLSTRPKNFSDNEIIEFKNYCNVCDVQDFNSVFNECFIGRFTVNNNNFFSVENTRQKILNFFSKLKDSVEKIGIVNELQRLVYDNCKNDRNYKMFVDVLNKMGNRCNLFGFEKSLFKEIRNVNLKSDDRNRVTLISEFENFQFSGLESLIILVKDCDELLKYEKIIKNFEKKYIISLNLENFDLCGLHILNSEDFFIKKHKNNLKCNQNVKISSDFFNHHIDLRISQIEAYYRCSAFYFFNYVLKINNQKKISFDQPEYGLLVHYILEKYLKEYYCFAKKIDVRMIVKEYLKKKFLGIYSEYKIKHMTNKISDDLMFLIEEILKMNSEESFIPKQFEVNINRQIRLENGVIVNLKGKIDRVDIDEKNKKFRIVDYKTGKKKFDLNDVLNGTDLQAVIYLNSYSVAEFEKSGAFYFSTQKKITDDDSLNFYDDKLSEVYFGYQGISNENRRKNRNIFELTKTQMNVIFKYSDFMIKQLVRNILNGEIVNNHKNYSGSNSGCENCEYREVCNGLDVSFIKPKKFKNIEEIIEKMCEKLENEKKNYSRTN